MGSRAFGPGQRKFQIRPAWGAKPLKDLRAFLELKSSRLGLTVGTFVGMLSDACNKSPRAPYQ